MEIINKQGQGRRESQNSRVRHIYLGLALIVIGTVWLLYNFDVIGYRFFDIFFSWEMLLLVIGGYLLSIRKWVAGVILTLLGAFFVLTNLFDVYIPFGKIVLPVLCIAAGLSVILSKGLNRTVVGRH